MMYQHYHTLTHQRKHRAYGTHAHRFIHTVCCQDSKPFLQTCHVSCRRTCQRRSDDNRVTGTACLYISDKCVCVSLDHIDQNTGDRLAVHRPHTFGARARGCRAWRAKQRFALISSAVFPHRSYTSANVCVKDDVMIRSAIQSYKKAGWAPRL